MTKLRIFYNNHWKKVNFYVKSMLKSAFFTDFMIFFLFFVLAKWLYDPCSHSFYIFWDFYMIMTILSILPSHSFCIFWVLNLIFYQLWKIQLKIEMSFPMSKLDLVTVYLDSVVAFRSVVWEFGLVWEYKCVYTDTAFPMSRLDLVLVDLDSLGTVEHTEVCGTGMSLCLQFPQSLH